MDLGQRMIQWRNGELSNSEMLQFLMGAMDEVVTMLQVKEEHDAETK
jgi:hypothetical protein